jgi:hypothetical protein
MEAIDPLPANRLRAPKPAAGYVSLADVAATNAHLPLIGQAVSWTSRIVGDRISEVYGPRVCDYVPDKNGRPWLVIDKHGGLSSLGWLGQGGQDASGLAGPRSASRTWWR